MNEAGSKSYMHGQRAVYRELLGRALLGLGIDDAPNDLAAAQQRIAALESELADARVQIRMLCEDFGDNDREDDDHLADVIEKHLGKHLHSGEVEAIDLLRRMRAEHVRLRAEGWLHGEPDPVHAEADVFLTSLDGEGEQR
jgi:hypothetical protein